MNNVVRRTKIEQVPSGHQDVWAEAERLVRNGMSVLPLEHGDKDPHSCIKHGVDDASDDFADVKLWRDDAPEANLGLAIRSFTVADYDVRSDAEGGRLQSLVMVPLLDALGGPRQNTPSGGAHFILDLSAEKPVGKWGGADIKTKGYIAVYPSFRSDCDGRIYQWARKPPPFDNTIPKMPLWLLRKPNDAMHALVKRLAGDITGLGDATGSGMLYSIVLLAGPALLTQEECWTLVETCPALDEWREKHKEKERRRKFEDAVEKGWKPHYEPTPEDKIAEGVFEKIQGQSVLAQTIAIKNLAKGMDVRVGVIQQAFREWKSANSPIVDIADQYARIVLDKHFAGGAHLVNTDGVLWRYVTVEGGERPIYWEVIRPDQVRSLIEAEIEDLPKGGDKRKASVISDALRLIKDKRAISSSVFGLTRAPGMVFNCRNNEVYYEGGNWVAKDHNPKSYLRHALPVDYDPEATCPTFERILNDICSVSSTPRTGGRGWLFRRDPEARAFVEELMASAVMPLKLHSLIAAIVGPGGNGKTTIAEVLEALGGPSVRVSPISDTWNSRFATAALSTRAALVDDDVSLDVSLDTGNLKNLSNPNQKREVEAKGGAHYDIWLNLTILLLGNDWPAANDSSIGWTRRTFGLQLTRIFYQKHDLPGLLRRFSASTEEELQREHGCVPADSSLMKTVIQDELPGVLNLLMRAFERMVARGGIIRPDRVAQDSASWLNSADVVSRFVTEELREAPAEMMKVPNIPVREVYEAFLKWRDARRIRGSVGHRGFSDRLSTAGCVIVNPGNVPHVKGRFWRRETL